jgi:DNA-directed RNA polymerase subunit RPC12/RpoP
VAGFQRPAEANIGAPGMRRHEVFELTCYRCGAAVELPCDAPHRCPQCGVCLRIEFRPQFAAAAAQFDLAGSFLSHLRAREDRTVAVGGQA